MSYTRRPLRDLMLANLQDYQDSLHKLAVASQARKMSAVKSPLSKGHKLGYLGINLGAAISLPKIKKVLAERILSEDAVINVLALERNPRNKALLRLIYLGEPASTKHAGSECAIFNRTATPERSRCTARAARRASYC